MDPVRPPRFTLANPARPATVFSMLIVSRRPHAPREPGITPGQRILCAVLCFVFFVVGLYTAAFLNDGELNRALDRAAALAQQIDDMRLAFGLDQPPAPAKYDY